MIYTPKANRKPAVAATACLTFSSLVFILFSFFTGEFASVVLKATAVVFIMAATLTVTRYLAYRYSYALEDDDFVIIRSNRAGSSVLLRLSYDGLTDVVKKESAGDRLRGARKINYCSTMFCREFSCLFYDDGESSGAILFEPDDFFVKELEKRIKTDIIL